MLSSMNLLKTGGRSLLTAQKFVLRAYPYRPYSSQPSPDLKRPITIPDIHSKYAKGVPITMCTAYDYITATWAQRAHSDMILVGDSLAMTSLGYPSTTTISLQEFQYHVKSVCRSQGTSLIVADMPFGSFEKSIPYAIGNAIDMMKLDENVTSVKLEVGLHTKDHYTPQLIKELSARGIPVMGHIGLTPQRAHSLGGFKVQANKDMNDVKELLETAKLLQSVGCWSMVLECVPHKVATWIQSQLRIPVIGIGAGNGTAGQVLVVSDLLGMLGTSVPKFVKQYESLEEKAVKAIEDYRTGVAEKTFPENSIHTFKIKEEQWQDFLKQQEDI
ncbi:hypothetical protein NCAS_0B01920 [Naumovozyma castellii]|uniref:3-methyl-2-oxobutanoate hydroxymethyltransferase n=1 Tax=Naumovozyma castellii TaxID=27288 RepID=G0VBF0_NAUCA|nr:hypothetical protein NCAS_0B01920 [Naumovozyma castellii CBS 4309]CCC68276.1 hypothetical protein NCAS_0B01920 [Naumovozyma castellii CBS 4309]